MQIEDIPEGYTEISHKKSDDRQVSLISNIFFGNYNQFLSFNQEGQTVY